MSMEYLDVCDLEGNPTGEVIARDSAHRDGVAHRTAHVWVVRNAGGRWEALLQKRAMCKESFPGQYDTSSAGHIPAGVEPLPSALRELQEELGITAEPEQLAFAGKFHMSYEKEFHGKPFRDNETVWVYVYSEPVDIGALTLQESEVEEVRWFGAEDILAEIRVSRERICAPTPGVEILVDFISRNFQGKGKTSAIEN